MFKWGFVGSVGLVDTIAKEIKSNKEMCISAVYSRNFEHCKAFALKVNAKSYSSFEDMVKEKDFDALYIAVPHAFHFHYAKIALENHIPVLCEKPLTLNLKSSKYLYELSKENNTYFAEAMWTWFNPTANKVKEWLKSAKIGEIKSLKSDFTIPSYFTNRKNRLYDPKLGGGALFDLGVYNVCYVYKLFGYPKEIISKAKMSKNGIDLKCKIILKYKNNMTAILTTGFLHLGSCNVVIKGTEGKIVVPFMFHSSRKAKLNGKNKETFIDKENINLYEREFVLVKNEILNGKTSSSYITPKESIDVMNILETIKKQIMLVYPNDMD